MRIATSQRITLGVSVGIVLLVGLIAIASGRRADALVQENLVHGRIVELVVNLRYLAVEYAAFGDDRRKTQWLAEDARLDQALREKEYDQENLDILNTIRVNHDAARRAFRQLVLVQAKLAAKRDNPIELGELQVRLISLLSAKSQDMISDAFTLSQNGYQRIIAAETRASALTMIFVIAMIGVIAMNSHLVARSVLKPLRLIQGGAEQVGGGDLTHRIGFGKDDEIGDLARAFDAMTVRLQHTRAAADAAQKAVHAQANLMGAVFNNMHDGLSIVDADLNIVRANPAARRFMGLEPDDPLPALWTDITGRYRADRVTPIKPHELQLGRVLRGEPVTNGELFLVNDKHPRGLCLESVTKSIAGDTDMGAALTIWHDVTAARRVEQTLRESEALKRAIIENAMDCIISIDQEGRIIDFNPAAEHTFGYRREDVLGRDLAETIIPPRLREAHRKGLAHYLKTGEGPVLGKRVELDAMRADGSEFPVELGITAMRIGEQSLFTAHLRDITERKRLDARLRTVVESAPMAIVMIDKTGAIALVNAQTEALFGYRRDELLGLQIEMLVPQRLRGGHPAHREGFFAHPQVRRMGAGRDLYGLRKNGSEFPVEIGLNPIETAEGQFVLSAIVDITERQRATYEISQLNETLGQRAAQLESANQELESFCYSVSHDLRAPLRAIDGFSRLLVEQYSPQANPEALRYLGRVRANAQQMGTLIDDLLAFSRLGRQPMAPQSINTTDLVQQCVGVLRAGGDGEAVSFTVGQLPDCEGDPGLIREVWMNLLSNAFKFSSKCAAPQVEAGTVAGEAAGGNPVYFVRDNGAGFDMRYADKLFGVFQRLHAVTEFPGTGVGLALAQRIVQRHGGRIWAEAQPGRGATFSFTLGDHHVQR